MQYDNRMPLVGNQAAAFTVLVKGLWMYRRNIHGGGKNLLCKKLSRFAYVGVI
jgi:hypothetical protein